MVKSLQQIEDHYQRQGLSGDSLRKALNEDLEYQSLLQQRKSVIKNKFGITSEEEKLYLLPNKEDYEILSMIKTLKIKNLTKEDKRVIQLIESQLKDDWRKPLIAQLRRLLIKYK